MDMSSVFFFKKGLEFAAASVKSVDKCGRLGICEIENIMANLHWRKSQHCSWQSNEWIQLSQVQIQPSSHYASKHLFGNKKL